MGHFQQDGAEGIPAEQPSGAWDGACRPPAGLHAIRWLGSPVRFPERPGPGNAFPSQQRARRVLGQFLGITGRLMAGLSQPSTSPTFPHPIETELDMKRFHLAAILMLTTLQSAAADPTPEPV